jgi:hypothetical protein
VAHTTNYSETFIAIAEDSSAERGTMLPEKAENPSDDVIFSVWADRQGLAEEEREGAREEFFATGRACLRASDLGKKYGWGIHHDAEGRVALFGVESEEYRAFMDAEDVAVVKAMRSSRR